MRSLAVTLAACFCIISAAETVEEFMKEVGEATWNVPTKNYVQARMANIGIAMNKVHSKEIQLAGMVRVDGEHQTAIVQNYFACNRADTKESCEKTFSTHGMVCEWCDHTKQPDWVEEWKDSIGEGSCYIKNEVAAKQCASINKTIFAPMIADLALRDIKPATVAQHAQCNMLTSDPDTCKGNCFKCLAPDNYGWRWNGKPVSKKKFICDLRSHMLSVDDEQNPGWCEMLKDVPTEAHNFLLEPTPDTTPVPTESTTSSATMVHVLAAFSVLTLAF